MDEDNFVERLKDFEDDTSVARKSEHNVKIELTSQVKEEDTPQKDTGLTTQRVKEWLAKVNPREEPDKLKEKDTPPKATEYCILHDQTRHFREKQSMFT